VLTIAACARTGAPVTQPAASKAPTGGASMVEATPVSYTTPHPPAQATALDGSYARLDSSWPQWWKCLRCADYRSAGGIWSLRFDRGTLRVRYAVTGWQSLASFVVQGDRLTLFNDPYCPEQVAEYRWAVRESELLLTALYDPCAFGLRAQNLQSAGWRSCEAAGATSPPGCGSQPLPAQLTNPPDGLEISVQAGDSRFFDDPPELIVNANPQSRPLPDGIQMAHSPQSIPYGIHRILWWEGDWVEISTALSLNAIGVQFQGEAQSGWARLVLDGQEIWQGDTAGLSGRHAGYVEISGLGPGAHTLRVENLNWEYRPVTVTSFGLRWGR
jgi:hypothetical protein